MLHPTIRVLQHSKQNGVNAHLSVVENKQRAIRKGMLHHNFACEKQEEEQWETGEAGKFGASSMHSQLPAEGQEILCLALFRWEWLN